MDPITPQPEQQLYQAPMPEHEHFLNKKFIVTFVVLILLGSSAYAGIWYWQKQQVAQEVVPTFTPRPTGPTADWQTYTDTQLGFTFNYPKTWSGGYTGYANKNVEVHPPNSSDPKDFFGVFQDNVTTLDQILGYKDITTLKISGKTAYQFYRKTPIYESFIYIPSANNIVIYFSPDTLGILQILSTLKFIE